MLSLVKNSLNGGIRSINSMTPINLIIFDVFDTLIIPTIPPALQYAEEARKFGLKVKDEDIQRTFKDSFKKLIKQHPVYGLRSGLSSSDDWWKQLIFESIKDCAVEEDKLQNVLTPLTNSLLNRFGSSKAYSLAEGVPNVLQKLNHLKKDKNRSLDLTLGTNSDYRILNACKDLGLGEYLELEVVYDSKNKSSTPISGPTLSYDVGFEKPNKQFFHAAVQRMSSCFSPSSSTSPSLSEMCQHTLYVGDQFGEDFLGAKEAGLQAVWLNREQKELTNEQLSQLSDSQKDLVQVHSILDIIEIVKQSWITH